jgi:hypothetical protein
MNKTTTSNHEKAPICAAFVKGFREVFGDVKVLYVEENGFALGEKEEWNVSDVPPLNAAP